LETDRTETRKAVDVQTAAAASEVSGETREILLVAAEVIMQRDMTIVVGVDAKTILQLRLSIQTWKLHRPEMWQLPWLVFVDGLQLDPAEVGTWLADDCGVRKLTIVNWPPPGADPYESQREKMLSGHIFVPAMYVATKWHAKIDTDAVASRRADWMPADWFEPGDGISGLPAYIAPRWSYTKGVGFLPKLDRWGDEHVVASFRNKPALNISQFPEQVRVGHSRMCSWVSFYRTEFSVLVASLCDAAYYAAESPAGRYKLPVPSQDTVAWYVAARLGLFHRIKNQKAMGWDNHPRIADLERRVAEILQCEPSSSG
jgi:hypothetical protein